MDITILNYVQDHFHNRITDIVFKTLSRIGNGGAVWYGFLLLIWNPRGKRYALMMMLSMSFAFLTSQILKPIIGRPRPFVAFPGKQLLIRTPSGYSCPSGHSSSSFAAAFIVCMASRPLGVPAFLLAFSIAFSRVFLFVHYPSDTIAGSVLGVLCALLVFTLYGM